MSKLSKKAPALIPDEVRVVEFLGMNVQVARVGEELYVVTRRLAEEL